LQRHCAGCHNEHSSRPFQLIEAKSRRDLGNHLLVTTNLDATLRQVDRENPAKSEVLVNAILPHGPAGRPILSGPNHPSYQRLATWVHSLKGPPKPAEAVAAPGVFAPAAPAPNEGFASARPSSPPPEAPAPAAPIDPGGAPSPGAQVATYRGSATHPAVPPNADFRTSPLLGGSGPVPAPTPGVPAPQPLGAAGPQAITLPGGEVVPVDTRALSRDDPADRAEASKKKPIKVDPALLEKILSGKAPR
ncbi:MAG TPA: hypothetical protein VF590_04280, partial [Isosphaeraceae bacterium]